MLKKPSALCGALVVMISALAGCREMTEGGIGGLQTIGTKAVTNVTAPVETFNSSGQFLEVVNPDADGVASLPEGTDLALSAENFMADLLESGNFTTGKTELKAGLYAVTAGSLPVNLMVSNDCQHLSPFETITLQTEGDLLEATTPYLVTNLADDIAAEKALLAALYPLSASKNAISFDFAKYNTSLGKYHTGVDIPAAAGTRVYSILPNGIVVDNFTTTTSLTSRGHTSLYSQYFNSFLVVKYPVGSSYRYVYYGHCVSSLSKGAGVAMGQEIAKLRPSYNTNNYLTPSNDHLHLSVNSAFVGSGWGYASTYNGVFSAGWLDPKGQFSFGPPAAPTNFRASDGTYTFMIEVTWSKSQGAKTYQLYRGSSSSGPWTSLGSTSATSFVDTAPTWGFTYYYSIRAVSAAGDMSGRVVDSGYKF